MKADYIHTFLDPWIHFLGCFFKYSEWFHKSIFIFIETASSASSKPMPQLNYFALILDQYLVWYIIDDNLNSVDFHVEMFHQLWKTKDRGKKAHKGCVSNSDDIFIINLIAFAAIAFFSVCDDFFHLLLLTSWFISFDVSSLKTEEKGSNDKKNTHSFKSCKSGSIYINYLSFLLRAEFERMFVMSSWWDHFNVKQKIDTKKEIPFRCRIIGDHLIVVNLKDTSTKKKVWGDWLQHIKWPNKKHTKCLSDWCELLKWKQSLLYFAGFIPMNEIFSFMKIHSFKFSLIIS